MIVLNEAQKGYLAGLMDGEGTIGIARATHMHYNKNSRRVNHQLRISIHNTNKEMVLWVKNTVGFGSVVFRKAQSKRHKPTYSYQTAAEGAERFIKLILPYLIIKKPQALLALEFRKSIRDRKNNGCGTRGLPANVILLREKYKASISLLNGNNGGVKNRKNKLWKNNGCELGEPLTGKADGNPEPSNRVKSYGRA